jgi:hypothetical protein
MKAKLQIPVLLSMVSLCMCILIGFPLMVEQISKRLTPEYIMFGTSMVYFFAQAVTAITVQLFGYQMADKSRYSTLVTLMTSMGIIFFVFLLSLKVEISYNNPFKAISVENTFNVNQSLGISTIDE